MENNGWVSRKEALATDLYSYGLLWWRLLHDDKDPFLALLGEASEILDNGAKEEMKKTGDLAILAQENIHSMSSATSTLAFVPEMVCCLLQVNPSARLDALTKFEYRNSKLGFRSVGLYWQDFTVNVNRFTSDRKAIADSKIGTSPFQVAVAQSVASDPYIDIVSLCKVHRRKLISNSSAF